MISFSNYRFGFARHSLARPFHFKGGFFTEKWINAVRLAGGPATEGVTGVGGNAVLWSDPAVSEAWSETGGNALMSLVAERAVQIACGRQFADPLEAFAEIHEEVHTYAMVVTGRADLAPTFSLNAMVALDMALWKLFAATERSACLTEVVPADYRATLAPSDAPLLRVPLISYNVPVKEVENLVSAGHLLLKIKLGQGVCAEEMVAKDSARLAEIHAAAGQSREVRYYLDANGRYSDIEMVRVLLREADRMGALERVVIFEEPFAYERKIDVSSLPVRVAADESLHDVGDLAERVALGYRALALKPAGKTLSLSLLMAAKAAEYGVPCFVADSACVPSLLQLNLAFAALLPPFPGVGMRVIESNGAQNYGEWNALVEEHTDASRRWMTPQAGAFRIDGEFLNTSGGLFTDTDRYSGMFS